MPVSRLPRAAKLPAGACALAALLTGCHHAPSPPDAFDTARAELQRHAYRTSLKDFDAALAEPSHAKDARVFYDRATAHYHLKEWSAAEADYGAALDRVARGDKELPPQFVTLAHYYRGLVRVDESKWAAAKGDLIIAARAYPKDWRSWDNLGYARYELGDYKGAVPDFNRGLAFLPNDPNDHFNRGYSLFRLGKTRQAIADFTAAIHQAPRWGLAYNWRGQAYFALDDYRDADADFSRAIKLIPKAWAWEYRCEARENLGRIKEALSDCNHAVAYYPRWSQAYVDRGWAKAVLGNNRAALADMNSAVKYDPHSASAYKWRGWVHERMSQYRGAFADYAHAARVDHSYVAATQARRALGNWILSAQRAGVTGFGIGSIDVARVENAPEPSQSEYAQRAHACGGYFDASDSYFDDCIQKGVDEAKNDQSSDQEAAEQAQAENDDVAARVQQDIEQQQAQAEAASANENENNTAAESSGENSGGESSGGGSEESSGGGAEEQPQEQPETDTQSEPAPEAPEVPESSSE